MRTKRLRGQNLALFLGLLPILLIALGLVVDFGKFMILHAQADALADTAALSAANALDLSNSTPGNWNLNEKFAESRARMVIVDFRKNRLPYEGWMEFRMDTPVIRGNEVRITIHADCAPVFLGIFGVGNYSVTANGYARAAVGINSEVR